MKISQLKKKSDECERGERANRQSLKSQPKRSLALYHPRMMLHATLITEHYLIDPSLSLSLKLASFSGHSYIVTRDRADIAVSTALKISAFAKAGIAASRSKAASRSHLR